MKSMPCTQLLCTVQSGSLKATCNCDDFQNGSRGGDDMCDHRFRSAGSEILCCLQVVQARRRDSMCLKQHRSFGTDLYALYSIFSSLIACLL